MHDLMYIDSHVPSPISSLGATDFQRPQHFAFDDPLMTHEPETMGR
jgi:hypothetical protein